MKVSYKIFLSLIISFVVFAFSPSEKTTVFAQTSCTAVRSEIGSCGVNSAGHCVVTRYDTRACAFVDGMCQALVANQDTCGWKYNVASGWVCGIVQGPGQYKPCCQQVLSCIDKNVCTGTYKGTSLRSCDAYTVDCQLPVSPSGCEPGTGDAGPPPTSPPTSTPTQTAYCQNILAYNNNWVLLTNTQLTQTKAGDNLYYCVTGFTNTGTFDMARFTINNSLRPNTTLLRPGTTADYCQAYTVPSATYNFSILGEIHNTILGWVQ